MWGMGGIEPCEYATSQGRCTSQRMQGLSKRAEQR